jgi:hypothetical protein
MREEESDLWEDESDFGDMQQLYSVREVYDDVKATRNALWDLAARKGDPDMQAIIFDHHGAWFTRTLTFLKMKRDIQYHGWEGQDLYDRYPEYSREMLNCIKDCPNPKQLGYIGMPTPQERKRNRDAFDEILERRKKDPYTYVEAGPTLRRLAREINESFLAEFDFAGAYRWSRHVWELVTGRADLSAPVEAMRALRIDDKLATRGEVMLMTEALVRIQSFARMLIAMRALARLKAAVRIQAFKRRTDAKRELAKRVAARRKNAAILIQTFERVILAKQVAARLKMTVIAERWKEFSETVRLDSDAKRYATWRNIIAQLRQRQKEIAPFNEMYEADRKILSQIEAKHKQASSDKDVEMETYFTSLERGTADTLNQMRKILNEMKSADTATFNELSQEFGELHKKIQENCNEAGGDEGSCAIMEISPSDLSDPE